MQDAAHRMALLAGNAPLFQGHCHKGGKHVFSVEFRWPGVLRIYSKGAARDVPAEEMLQGGAIPGAAFMLEKQRGQPLAKLVFMHGDHLLRAVFGLDGVLTVRDQKTGDLIAESEPGRPEVLASGRFGN